MPSRFSTLFACPACGYDKIKDEKIYNGFLLKRCDRCEFVFTAERNFSTAQYEDVYSGVTTYHMMIDDARQTHERKKGFRELWWFKRKALQWLHAQMPISLASDGEPDSGIAMTLPLRMVQASATAAAEQPRAAAMRESIGSRSRLAPGPPSGE